MAVIDYGEFQIAVCADGTIQVVHADPRILISAEILDDIRHGTLHPNISLKGDVLTINGSNRKVIYRVGSKLEDRFAYCAEWPD